MRIVLDLQGAQSESRFRGIGRYSLALAQAIARNASKHEVFLAINAQFPDTIDQICRDFSTLLPTENIHIFNIPIPNAEMDPANAWRARAAENIREHFLAGLSPDIVHISSLFEGWVDNAAVSVGAFTQIRHNAMTLYDLIPLLKPEDYLNNQYIRDYYNRKLQWVRNIDLLLAISESSRQEGIKTLKLNPNKVVNISASVDNSFHPLQLSVDEKLQLQKKYNITHPFILYAPGGFDNRKNFEGLFKAYSYLPLELRLQYQLVITGNPPEGNRRLIDDLTTRLGIKNQVILSGRVPDNDLISLYNVCHLFIFPSLHEGFGLPVLEAMACGAPTIGSNTTSIPEALGRSDALFDPINPQSIADKIVQVLTNDSFRQKLSEHGLQQVKNFSWDLSAKKTIDAFEQIQQIDKKQFTKSWRNILDVRQKSYQELIRSLSELDHSKSTSQDLINTAISIYKNNKHIDLISRRGELPKNISWRIEGPFDSTYSLALLNRETARALSSLGHEVVLHSTEGPGDFAPKDSYLEQNNDLKIMYERSFIMGQSDVQVCSRILFPPRVEDMHAPLNLLHHYAWEESGLPPEWVNNFNEYLQGITCLSSHVQKIMIDNGITVPLSVSGCGVDHWENIEPDPTYKVQAKTFRFLHVSSCFPRKAADVLLKAYGQAFKNSDDVSLIIKTFPNPHNTIHDMLAECKKGNRNFPDAIIIENDLTDEQLKELYKQCQVLVAPSRAEGFGVPLAEAILSGLSVITTNWGGQLDFCFPETSWLVDFSFKYTYTNTHFNLFDSVWAEPDVDHLANVMREVYNAPDNEKELRIKRGRELLLRKFKWVDATSRLVSSARQWMRMPDTPTLRIGWISTWNTRCGVATYSEHLTKFFPSSITMLSPRNQEKLTKDDSRILRCWDIGEDDLLTDLDLAIKQNNINTIVIQFNYGFFNLSYLSQFIERQITLGNVVVVELHSTNDPVHVPHKKLAILTQVLAKCDRVLVHSVADLNRLKNIGLINNVTLFPHGALDNQPINKSQLAKPKDVWKIGTYGFFLPHKGLIELIEAMAILKRKYKKIQLKMVNAEYPADESRDLIQKAKIKIKELHLDKNIEILTNFLPDEVSLTHLSEMDLIVFPYQLTGESASGAIRFGMLSGKPVIVSPLPIFDDIAPVVWKLPGTSPQQIAEGILSIINDLKFSSPKLIEKEKVAEEWRVSHQYSKLSQRFDGMLLALLRTKTSRVEAETKSNILYQQSVIG